MYIPPFSIEPTEIVGGCIALYKNVWPDPAETIKTIDWVTEDKTLNLPFKNATTLNEAHNSKRTNKHLSLTDFGYLNEEFRLINNMFFNIVFSAVSSYRQLFGIEEQLYWNEGINLLKYQTGEEYKAHYDGGTGTKRSVSPILYLNEDYTGGEIEFVNQGITIKPTTGLLAIFPANYAFRHIAHPVKTGTKYAIVTWLHDRQ